MSQPINWIDDAGELADNGFVVLPIKPDTKRPAVSWRNYQERRPTDAELDKWAEQFSECLVGVVTGALSGVVVLDLDSEEAQAYVQERGITSPVRVKTRRGKHLYFRHPNTRVKNRVGANAGKTGWPNIKGLDLRGDGGIVVCPTTGNDSKAWDIDEGYGLADLSELPVWDDGLIIPTAPSSLLDLSNVDATFQIGDEWADTAAYILEHYPHIGKLPEGSRNQRVFNYASQCVLKGITGDALIQTVNEFMNTLFVEPLPDDEVRATIQSVWTLEMRNHPERFDLNGNYVYQHPSLAHAPLPPVEMAEPEQVSLTIRNPKAPTICQDNIEEIEAVVSEIRWLVRPFFTESSITQVYGYTGNGKSTILYRILHHLAIGKNFGMLFDCEKPASVLYFDFEQGMATINRHMKTMRDSYGNASTRFSIWTPKLSDVTLKTVEGMQRFLEFITEHRPDVVVIDTVRSAVPGMRENDADAWSTFNQLLLHLRNAGLAVIWLHHGNKPSADGVGKEAGSSNQLTVTETQLRVALILDDAEEAKMKGARLWSDLPEGTKHRLTEQLPDGFRPAVSFELAFGKVREWTDEHQAVMYVMLARNQNGEERIVTSRNKRNRAELMWKQGKDDVAIAQALGLDLAMVQGWLKGVVGTNEIFTVPK